MFMLASKFLESFEILGTSMIKTSLPNKNIIVSSQPHFSDLENHNSPSLDYIAYNFALNLLNYDSSNNHLFECGY